MARVKYGAIVTDIKGKIGGTVFQGSKTGGVMKNNTAAAKSAGNGGSTTKADAGRVTLPKRNMTEIASTWKTLSAADRASWNLAAPNFPFIDKYGNAYTASGYQVYMSVNNNLAVTGQSMLSTAPPAPTLANMMPFGLSWLTLGTFTMALSSDVPAGYVCQLYATVGMSAGKAPRPGDYRLIQTTTAFGSITPSILSLWTAQFGTPVSGATVWVQGKLTEIATGRNGETYNAKVVIPV